MSPRAAAALASSGLLAALCLAAPASGATPPPPTPPPTGEASPQRAAPAASRLLVELGELRPTAAQRLAQILPEYGEPINAGTRQLALSREQALAVEEAGFSVRLLGPAQNPPAGWPSCYRRLAQLHDWMEATAEANPDLAELLDIGDSWCKQRGRCITPGGDRLEGHDLLVLRLTNERASSPKEGRLWINGGVHPRELPPPELMAGFVSHLVEGYGQDAQITYLLDHRELYVLVVANPDGRSLVELGTRRPYNGAPWYWRKNARSHRAQECEWPPRPSNHYGVDLNRNHSFKWTAPGHSTNPCAETYRGRSAGSEPETQAYEAFLRSIFPDQRGPADGDAAPPDTTGMMIDVHNFTSQGTVLIPWGWSGSPTANDTGLVAIARRYTAAIGYDWRYALYPVSGGSRDWAYGRLGIPALLVELAGADFMTPCPELPAIIRQQLAPLEMALGISDRPYERIRGPEVRVVDALPEVQAGQRLTILAQLDEDRAGRDVIAAAEVTIGRPGGPRVGESYPHPGLPPGSGIAMSPADGAFDSVLELARLELDTSGLATGWYYLAVRGRDVAGHWGPIKTRALQINAPPPSPTPTASATATPTATLTSTTTATPTSTPTTPTPTASPGPTPVILYVPLATDGGRR